MDMQLDHRSFSNSAGMNHTRRLEEDVFCLGLCALNLKKHKTSFMSYQWHGQSQAAGAKILRTAFVEYRLESFVLVCEDFVLWENSIKTEVLDHPA